MNKKTGFIALTAAVGAALYWRRHVANAPVEIVGTQGDTPILRTPAARFQGLPDFPFEPHYMMLDGLRMHYVDEGPPDGEVVLLLHGEPSWSYLYRKMIPPLVAAGYRTVAPDLIGFGRSDKPAAPAFHSYGRHVDWIWHFIEQLGLDAITVVVQDWGSLIGLRLVGEHPERFARVVATNATLPTGDQAPGPAFSLWQAFAQYVPILPIGQIIQLGTATHLPPAVVAAYEAPFPNERYKAGARALPALVPTTPHDPASEANRRAWESLRQFDKPFLTAYGDQDPILGQAFHAFHKHVPGTRDQPHTTLKGAGHFSQEDQGEMLARLTIDFMAANPL